MLIFRRNAPNGGVSHARGILLHLSNVTKYSHIIMGGELETIPKLSNGAISNDFE